MPIPEAVPPVKVPEAIEAPVYDSEPETTVIPEPRIVPINVDASSVVVTEIANTGAEYSKNAKLHKNRTNFFINCTSSHLAPPEKNGISGVKMPAWQTPFSVFEARYKPKNRIYFNCIITNGCKIFSCPHPGT